MTEPEAAPDSDGSESRAGLKLFLIGFQMLFLELALIRYLCGTIWNLGYFPNLVLLAVFIGMGCGFVFHERIAKIGSGLAYHLSVVCLGLLVVMVQFGSPSVPGFERFGTEVGGDLYFSHTPEQVSESFGMFAAWFLGVASIYVLMAQRAARLFRLFKPLKAYTLDIAGSCAGIVTFMLMSWGRVSADRWFFLLVPVFVLTLPKITPARILGSIVPFAAVIGIIQFQDSRLQYDPTVVPEVVWSPYQKLELLPGRGPQQPPTIFANGVWHQGMEDLRRMRANFYQPIHSDRLKRGLPPFEKVFVIGGGSGNDVAMALANGAKRVHAVEIDPAIAEFGRKNHPEKPYSDPRVELTINDARAALERSREQFDLVVFALTDSVVKASAMAQLRLENYIYTVESIKAAYEHLDDDGDILFYNFYRKDWLVEKLQQMIREGTGKEPRVIWKYDDFVVITVGKTSEAAKSATTMALARDDWPFFYLKERGVAGVYLAAMAGMISVIAGLLLLVWRLNPTSKPGSGYFKVAFVLMGSAFLLLETKSIIQFSLLFGTTWINTSLVFLSVLLLVLAANWTAATVGDKLPVSVVFGLLLVSALVPFVYPLANLLSIDDFALRFVLASLLTFLPVFFANLLFSISFKDKEEAELLFGWNLIGATLGGIAEYSSMAIGYSALAIIVAILYALVFACLALGKRSAEAA